MRLYLKKNVLEVARERLDYIFDRYENIVVSVSGGKDSTLLEHLTAQCAKVRSRKIHAFFLDQEAEYQATIDIIWNVMYQEYIIPHWFQVPIYMTNATSYDEDFLYAWGPGESWMRGKDPIAIHKIEEDYPQRFYPFIDWFEDRWEGTNTCFLVGLRAEESLNRYRVMIKNPGIEGILWSTRNKNGLIKFYPIYDWSFDDVFYYFYQNKVKYNRIYDYLHAKDESEHIRKFRVSNLIHEKAYRSLTTLQEFEHDTYEKMVKRLKGTRTAARYANEAIVYSNLKRPKRFETWLDYRDYLLTTISSDRLGVFKKRFAKQEQSSQADKVEDWKQKWMEIL